MLGRLPVGFGVVLACRSWPALSGPEVIEGRLAATLCAPDEPSSSREGVGSCLAVLAFALANMLGA